MPPKKQPRPRVVRTSSDEASDSEEERRPRKVNRNAKTPRSRPSARQQENVVVDLDENDSDFYDESEFFK